MFLVGAHGQRAHRQATFPASWKFSFISQGEHFLTVTADVINTQKASSPSFTSESIRGSFNMRFATYDLAGLDPGGSHAYHSLFSSG